MEEQIQKRSIAKIVPIIKLINGIYEEKPGWEPNVIKTDNDEIARVNIVGTVVAVPEGITYDKTIPSFECTIDDGTGTIEVKSFEPIYSHSEISLGCCLLVIGKPKQYQEKKFIVPEIIRVVDKKWMRDFEVTQEQEKPVNSLIDVIDTLDEGEGVFIEELKQKMGDDVEERINKLLLVGEVFEVRPGRIKVLK